MFNSFKTSCIKHKKWIAAAVLAIGIGTGGLIYGDDVVEKAKGISLFNNESPADSEESTTEIIYLKISTEYANVRSEPSLDSSVVFSIDQSTTLGIFE